MNKESSIGSSLGLVTGAVGAGIAGTVAWRTLREMRQAENLFKTHLQGAKTAAEAAASVADDGLVANSKALGLDGILLKPTKISMINNYADFAEHIADNESFFNTAEEFRNKLRNTYSINAKYKVMEIPSARGSVTKALSMELGGHSPANLGFLSTDGVIKRAANYSTYQYNAYVPKYFITPEGIDVIKTGNIGSYSSFFNNKNYVVDYNTAKLKYLDYLIDAEYKYTNHMSAFRVGKLAQHADISFNQFSRNFHGLNQTAIQMHQKSVVPLVFDFKKANSLGPRSELTSQILTTLSKAAEVEGNLVTNPLWGNIQDISSGITKYAYGDPVSAPSYLVENFDEYQKMIPNKKMAQALLRDPVAEFADPVTGELKMSPVSAAKVYYVPQDDALMTSVLRAGIGNEGTPIPHLPLEGVLSSAGLKKEFDIGTVHLPTKNAYIPEKSANFLNALSYNYAYMNDNSLSSLNAKYNLSKKDVLNYFGGHLTKEKHQAVINMLEEAKFKTSMASNLQKMINEGHAPQMLEDLGRAYGHTDGFDATKFFGKNAVIGATEVGKVNIAQYGQAHIQDLALTQDGIDMLVVNNSSSGKFWFSLKGLEEIEMKNSGAAAQTHFALKREIEAGRLTEEKAVALLEGFRVKDSAARREIEGIVGRYSKYNTLFSNTQITATDVIGETDEMINRMTLSQTERLKRANPNLSDAFFDLTKAKDARANDYGMLVHLKSHAPGSEYKGYGTNATAGVNYIMYDRLMATGQNEAARLIAAEFNIQGMKDTASELGVLFNTIPQDSIGFKHSVGGSNNYLTRNDFDVLFGPDTKAARSRAMAIASIKDTSNIAFNTKNVSDATKFYIEISKDTAKMYVPIPMKNTGYIGVQNYKDLMQEGEPIRKKMTSEISNFMYHVQNNTEGIESQYKKLQNTAAEIILDARNFQKMPGRSNGTSFLQARKAFWTDPDFLTHERKIAQRMGRLEQFNQALLKHGFDPTNLTDFGTRHTTGVTSKNFWALAKQTEDYAELMKSGKINDMYKIGLTQLGTRPPSYGLEAVPVTRTIDIQAFARDLFSATGASSKALRNNFSDFSIYGGDDFFALSALDNDDDPVITLLAKSKDSINKIKSETPKISQIVRDIYYQGKSTKKLGSLLNPTPMDDKMAEKIEKELVESRYIAELYNESRPYSMSYNPMIVGSFKDSPALSAVDKSYLMEHFLSEMPEFAIGGKNLTRFEQGEYMISLFKKGLSADEKVSRFRTVAQSLSGGANPSPGAGYTFTKDGVTKSVFDLIDNSELKEFFSKGEQYVTDYPEMERIFTKRAASVEDINQLRMIMKNRGGTPVSNNFAANMVAEAVAERSKGVQKFLGGTSDLFERAFPKILKDKRFLALGAAGLVLGYALRSRDSDLKNQEVREESRSKGGPSMADPIDPPTGYVNRPGGRNYKFNISGKLPDDLDVNSFRRGLSDRGISLQNTYIDKSNNIDSRYMRQLRDEDRSNKWNGR